MMKQLRSRRQNIGLAMAVLMLFWQIGQPLNAATVYWDINGSTAGASGTGSAAGTWDGANVFFNTDSTGGAGGSLAAWTGGDTLVLSGGVNATQAYSITVSGTRQIGGLTFEEGTVTLTGGTLQMTANSDFNVASGLTATINSAIDGAFNLSKLGAGTLVLGGTNTYSGRTILNAGTLSISSDGNLGAVPSLTADSITFSGNSTLLASAGFTLNSNRGITLNGGVTGTVRVLNLADTLTYGGVITGAAGTTFTKAGAGTLDLQGVNTLAGALNVDGGTLKLSGAGTMAGTSGVTIGNRGTFTLDNAANNQGDRTAGAITSSGGTINFIANAAATTETVGALTLNAGALTVNSTAGAGGSTLTVPSITRNAGGTLYVNGTGLGGGTNQVVLTTANALTNTILPWAVVNNGTVARFATHGGNGTSLAPQTAGASYQAAETAWTANTVNALPTTSQALSGARTLYSLTLDNGINLTAATSDRTLTIGSGGIGAVLQTGGTSTIGQTGTIDNVLAFGTNEAVFHILGTLQTIRADSTAGLTGSGGLTKSGPGTLILGGQSSLTGTYRINEGILESRRGDSLNSTAQPVHLNGGMWRLAADAATTFTGSITVNADSTIQVDRVTAAATATTHTVGTLSIGGGRSLFVNSNDITSGTAYGLTTGALTLTSGGAIFDVANNGAGTGTMTVGAPSGAFALTKTGTGDLVTSSITTGFSGAVDIQAGRVGWSGTSGTITEGQIFSGAGGIIRNGTGGTTNLTGANTFTGGVTVTAGALGFSTVSDNGGSASNLGQGTNGITLSGGTLSFIGGSSQSTNRAITVSAASTLSANGTSGATITYSSPITVSPTGDGTQITLGGTAGSVGIITGGITQTGDTADATVSGGTWTFPAGTSRIGDDLTVTGATTIMNLNGGLFQVRDDLIVTAGGVINLNATGVLSYNIATLSGDATLGATNGGIINLGANNAVVATEFDRLFLGQSGGGAVATLNMSNFNLTTSRFILGERATDREGLINGTGTLTVTGGDIDVLRGTINANLASTGTTAFEKFGGGTVTLKGDNSGLASTGDTIVYEGLLVLDYTAQNNSKISSTEPLDMRGGTLRLDGSTAGATTQTVNSLILTSGGASKIDVNNGVGQSITLNLGAITRAAGAGTIRFELPTTGNITTTVANTSGILGGYATVTDSAGITNFAANDGSNNIIGVTSTTQDTISSWVAGQNISDSAGFTGNLNCANISSLRFDANAASAVTINAGGFLGIASGGILMTSAAATGAHTISGGRLVSGTQELVFTQDSATTLTVSSTITGNTAVTKTGNGVLSLTGLNNNTGATLIQAGTLVANGNSIGDASAVTLSDDQVSTFQITASETIGSLSGGNNATTPLVGTVAIGGNTLTINQGAALTYAGVFTGSGTLIKTGSAALTLSGNTTTGFTGPVIINQGQLAFTANLATLSSASSFTINAGGELLVDNNNATDANSIGDGIGITLNNTFSTNGLFVRTNQGNTKTEDVGAVLLGAGHNTITSHGSATNAISDLIMDGLTTSNRATALVRGNALGAGAGTRGNIRASVAAGNTALNNAEVGGGGAAASTTISIIPWLVGDVSQTGVGSSFVTNVDATVGLRPLDLATEYLLNSAAPATGSINVRYNATTAITTPATINSLMLDGAATVALTGSASSMEITSGAILATLAGAHTIGGFTGLTTGGGRDYTIYTTTAAGSLNISTPLASTVPLVKSGAGALILSSATANAFTDLYFNQGAVQATAVNQTGTGVFNFSGGILRFAGVFDPSVKPDTTARTINFNSGGGTFDTNGNNISLANTLGSGSGTFTKIGAGNLTLNGATGGTLTGATAITAGTVTLGAAQAIGTGALTVSGATTVLAMGSNTATVAGLTMTTAGASITGSGTLTVNGDAIMNNSSSIAPILGGSMNLFIPGGGALTLSNAANTFTGYTWVQSGGVSVLNLANAGVASGLGAPLAGDNAAIRLGSTTTAGTVTITATTGTGGTTDRPFWLTGTTGGGTIDNDGTGALILNGNIMSAEYGAKTITLQGATTGFNNVLNGIIDQCVGTMGLTKAEAGTWVLANTTSPSTYTGINTITAGTLQVNRATGGLGDSTAVNAINLNGGTLSFRNDGAGNNGTVIYGSASNATGYNVQLSATSTINVDNLTANTGNTIQLGPLTQATAAARTLNVTGANGYTLTLPSLGLSTGTGQTTTLNPTTASIIVTGNVTNPMSGFGTGNFDTIVLDGTSTGNVIGGTISDAVGGGFTPVLLGGYTIVTKSNSSTWTLNGSGSTYTGNTNINGGVLIAGTDTSLGNSLISFGGGTLNNQDENRAFANNLQMAGAGTLTGTGNFAFNGNINQTGGSQTLNINNTGTATFGDASSDTLTLAENNQARTLTLNVANTAAASVNATIQDGTGTGADGLTKTGLGSLSINASNSYTGATTLDNGTTTFTATQNLAATTNSLIIGSAAATTTPVTVDFDNVNATFGGALTMNINSATASTITVDAARTLSIGGNVQIGATTPAVANTVTKLTLNGGGAFNVTTAAAGTFTVGGSTSTTNAQDTTLDLTALASTTINTSTTGTLRVNPSGTTNLAGAKATLLLPTPVVADTVATATITAGTIAVGNASLFNSQAGQINTITLGTGLTTLNANTINVGTGSRDIGQIIYGQADGDLIIRAADGTSRATLIAIGTGGASTGTTEATTNNLVDFSSHDADILVTSLNVGNQARIGNLVSEFKFGAGDASLASVLDATNVNIGFRTGTASTTSILTNRVNLSGGTVTFGNVGGTGTGVDIGNSTYNQAGAASTIGELNISGGTVTIHNSTALSAAVRLGTNVAAGGGTVTASMNLTGGSTTLGGHIIRNATAPRTTSTLLLDGASATLDMGGFNIGTATELITFDLRQGTLQNLGEFNGGANLVKTTSGTLTIGGTNTYTGSNVFQEGTVIAAGGAANRLSQTGLTLGNSTTSAVLQLGNGSGSSDQTLTSLATSGTGTANAIVGGNATASTLTINQSTNTTFEGNIGGTGTNQNNLNLVKSGVGELVISGTAAAGAAWTGTTTVNGGKLFIDNKNAFAATSTSLTVADGAEFSTRGTGLTANQVYGFSGTGNKITLGTGTGTAVLGFSIDGTFNTQLQLLTGQTMTVATGTTFQTAVYVGSAPTAGQGYVLIDGADNLSLHAGGGTFDVNPVVFNGGSFTYALSNVTLGNSVDRWVLTPTAQAAAADVWWKGDLTGIGTGVWSASTTSGTGFPTNWDDSQSGGVDALVPPDSGSIVHFSATGAANFATTLGANLTIQELIFHSGGTAISVDGNTGTYTLTLGNGLADPAGLTLLTGAPNVSITADVALAKAQSFNIADTASTLTFSRGLSGTGALGINDNGSSTGTMILSGVNGLATYTGATNLVAGRLILEGAANNRLPTTTALTMGNATLGATLQLGDAVNGASNTTIGTLNTGAATTNAILGGGATASTLTIVQGGAGTFRGVIGGGGTNENNITLIKQGTAQLTLNGANTYTGGTTVNNGILQLGSSGGINGSASLAVNANAGATATFDNNGRTTILAGGITLGGADSSATPLIANSTAGGSITLGGNVLYDGTNNPLGGSIAAPLDLGTAARTFTANDSTTAATDLTISGAVSSTAGNVGANGIGLVLDGTGSGLITSAITLANGTTDGANVDVTKNGIGTWTIQNTVTVRDDYLVNSGILTVSGAGSLVLGTAGDFVADTVAAPVVNFNVVNSIVGGGVAGTNRIFARDGSTINLNATNAIGTSIEQIILGDDNQGIGNLVLAGGTTNTTPLLQIGFNSAGEQGNISGTGTLNVTTTLTYNNGTVSANLSGAAAATRDNNLTVTLSGNNSLTGTTLNREGTLNLDFSTNAGTDNKMGTGAFTVGHVNNSENRAITNFIGNASAASTQTVASLAVAGGPSEINLTSAGGQNMTFAVSGALTRASGTLNVSLPDANTIFSYAGPTTNTNGIVGGWMTLNNTDFATISGGQIVAATYTTQNNPALWGTNQNITNSGAFTGTVDADCNTINSLRFNATAASTITIGTGNNLILTSGGILETAAVGANASLITGGNLISGTNEFIITQNNTSSTLTIASRILSGAATSPVITKNGAGVLVLSGTNNQTGTINIEEGTLRLSGGSAVSDTSIINLRNVTGATLELVAGNTETIGTLQGDFGGNVILNSGSTLTVTQGTAQNVNAVISGAGTLVKSGSATLTLNNTSTMTGTVRVDNGQVLLNGNFNNLGAATAIILNGPTSSIQSNQDQAAATNRLAGTVLLNNTGGGTGLATTYSALTAAGNDSVGALTLGAGHNVITSTSSTAFAGSTTFASLAARNNRATVLVRGAALGDSATATRGQIIFTTAPTGANVAVGGGGAAASQNISIFPWMVGSTSATGLGNSFVMNTGATNGLRPLATTEYINDSTAITGTLTDNIRYTATTAITATPTAINSLVLDSGTAIALTGSASSMEITSGAILAAGAGNHSIGTISGITTGGSRDYTVYVTTAASTLTMNTALTSAVPLVKSGAGTLSLTNTGNLFTDVFLNQGTLLFDGLDKVNGTTGTLNFFGGGVRLAAGFPLADDLSTKAWNINTGGGTIDVSLVTAGTTFANGIDDTTVSSADTLNLFTRSSATGSVGQLTIGGASTYTGTVVVRNSGINSGVVNGVVLNGTTNAAINGNLIIGNEVNINNEFDAVVALGASDQIVDTASITFRGVTGEFAYFKLRGFNETVAGISDTTATGVVQNHESATDTVAGNGTLTVNSSSDFSFNGFMRDRSSGTGGTLAFTKQGTGTQTLSGALITYTGATTISGGTLQLTDATAFAASSAITNDANLTINRATGTQTFANIISGSGSVTKLGAGTVTLSGATSSYSGLTDIQQGILSVSASANLGNASATNDLRIANGATLQATGTFSLGANRDIVLSGVGGLIEVTGSNILTTPGIISGDDCQTLTKTGTGTLVLTGANTYDGGTIISAGTLQLGDGGTTGSLDPLSTITNNATLVFNQSDTLTQGGDFAANITGTGAVTQAGTGKTILNGTNSYTGVTTVSTGTLQFATQTSLYGDNTGSWIDTNLVVNSGATAAFNVGGTGEFTSGNIATLAALGTATSGFRSGSTIGLDTTNATGAFTYSTVIENTNAGANTVGVNKLGSGTLVLNQANTYTGLTTVSAGVLAISNNSALGGTTNGTSVAAGGTLSMSGGITVTGESLSLTAGAGGSATLNNQTGNNTWTGNLTVDTGADGANRALLNSEAGKLTVSGNVNLTAGTADFVLRGDGNGEISGQITGSQRLFKSSVGTGTWILSGDNSGFTGRTTISNGAIQIAAESNLGAVPVAFAANQLTLGGSSTQGTLITTGTTSLSSNRGVTIAGGGGTFEVASSTTTTVNSVITGAGAITKAGEGTLIFSGTNTYTGKTIISAGKLSISSEANLGANPGSSTADQLTLNGGTLQTTATLTIGDSNRGITVGASGGTIETAASTTATVNSVILGSGTLVKTGPGTLIFTAANTYTGKTNIAEGALSVASINSVSGGSSSSNLGAPTTVSNGTIGLGSSTITGRLIYTGSGETTDRVLDLAGTTGGGTIDQSGTGLLKFTSDLTATGAGSKVLTLQGSTAGSGEISGAIVDNSGTNITSVEKTGTGTWVLSGANTYTGTTTVTQGTLSVGSSANLGSGTSSVILGGATTQGTLSYTGPTAAYTRGFTVNAGGGQLEVTNSGQTLTVQTGGIAGTGGSFTVAGDGNTTISSNVAIGTGALIKTGTGTLVLSADNSVGFTSKTSVTGGTLSVSADNNLGAAPGAAVADQLTLDGGTLQATESFTLAANRGVTLGAADGTISTDSGKTLTVSGVINGTSGADLTKSGTGTLVLSGSNTYTGNTMVNAGTLQVGDGTSGSIATASVVSVASGASLAVNLANSGTLASNISNDGTVAAVGPNTNVISGAISGSGNFAQSGSGSTILSGSNSYNGTTTVSNGQLHLTGSLAGGDVKVGESGGSLPSNAAILSGNGTIGGMVTIGDGGVGILRPGSAAGSDDNGTLTITTNAVNALTVNSGSEIQMSLTTPTVATPTTFTFLNGVYNFGSFTYSDAASLFNAQTSTLAEVNVAPDAAYHDFINLTGANSTIDLGGTLRLTTLGAFTPNYGQVFNLFDWGSVATPISNFDQGTGFSSGGNFGDFVLPTLGGGLAWDTSAFTTYGILVVVPEPSRVIFLMLGLLGMMLRRRRR
jgi:fibronectin-binding autotransporter adhesin